MLIDTFFAFNFLPKQHVMTMHIVFERSLWVGGAKFEVLYSIFSAGIDLSEA